MIKKGNVEELLLNPVSFLADASTPDEDIAISSRIRLARNLAGTPFPANASPEWRAEIRDKILGSLNCRNLEGKNCRYFNMEELDEMEKEILLERHLASRELITGSPGSALVVRGDEAVSLMINEEDQLRLQAIRPGFSLRTLWKEIDQIDDNLSGKLDFAFDSELGYLTSCPTNVGTGMRASVMLHLPALVLSGRIAPTIQGINKLNLAVRGIYGEGTKNLGNLFQVSNQATLGESEGQIIDRLCRVITDIIEFEKEARSQLLKQDKFGMLNHVGRAYGILRYGYKITSGEALNCLSGIRAGVDLKLFKNLTIHNVNELFIAINSGHLQYFAGKNLSPEERDVFRATFCRTKLADWGTEK